MPFAQPIAQAAQIPRLVARVVRVRPRPFPASPAAIAAPSERRRSVDTPGPALSQKKSGTL